MNNTNIYQEKYVLITVFDLKLSLNSCHTSFNTVGMTNEFRTYRFFSTDGRLSTEEHFNKYVQRYNGYYRIRKFSCYDQYLCLSFAQLTYRESLRDIETCLRALQPKLYHSGMICQVARGTLAVANEKRDWRIYADFANILINIARKLYANDDFAVAIEQTAYAFDSTTIDLCLSLFPWARFRRCKGVIKLHTLIDLRWNIPCFIYVTEGKFHDVINMCIKQWTFR